MFLNLGANTKGFTLVEMLVSMGVIALLAGIFLTNYHDASRRSQMPLAAQRMVSDIRLAQSRGMGSTEYNGITPAGGWGFYCDRSANDKKYFIFADINGNRRYDAGEAEKSFGGSEVNLPENVSFDDLKFENDSVSRLDITFVPPDPITNIYNSGFSPATTTTGSIILLEEYENSTCTIGINSFGLIEIE